VETLVATAKEFAMPAYFKIDKEQKLVMSTAAGVFTMADVLEHQEKLLKDSDFDPSFSHLVDLTHITKFDLETEGIHRLAQQSLRTRHPRIAFPLRSKKY